MGILIDPKKAKASSCMCYVFGDPERPEDRICFTQGIIGTLSNAQEEEYCFDGKRPMLLPATDKQLDRIKRLRILGEIMRTCLDSEEPDFLGCMRKMIDKLEKETEEEEK